MLKLLKEVYSSIKGLFWAIGWQLAKLAYGIIAQFVDIGISLYKFIKG
jgi:hypothetical protein